MGTKATSVFKTVTWDFALTSEQLEFITKFSRVGMISKIEDGWSGSKVCYITETNERVEIGEIGTIIWHDALGQWRPHVPHIWSRYEKLKAELK